MLVGYKEYFFLKETKQNIFNNQKNSYPLQCMLLLAVKGLLVGLVQISRRSLKGLSLSHPSVSLPCLHY